MPINNFSVGRDVSLTAVLDGQTVTFSGLTSFTADPKITDIKSKGIDGTTRFGFIPDGYEGSFKLDRIDAEVDRWWAKLEAMYFSGQNILAGTIMEVIQEADGSITTFRYSGVTMHLTKAGDWGGDKKVEQEVKFFAAKRELV